MIVTSELGSVTEDASAALRAGPQATRFPGRLDEIPTADAVGAVITVGEGVRKMPHRHLRRTWLCGTSVEALDGLRAVRPFAGLSIRRCWLLHRWLP
ncbi:hypothetical protein, partial [Belnapia moabensis]|uniref:hypothetical protein n=1 Tax=Belnapia moabensis TaxID=365533 RepID=UPI001B80CF02